MTDEHKTINISTVTLLKNRFYRAFVLVFVGETFTIVLLVLVAVGLTTAVVVVVFCVFVVLVAIGAIYTVVEPTKSNI